MSTILLVEDDPILGRGLAINLEAEGYKVNWVSGLLAAFEANQKSKLDLIIIDLGLPDGSGLDLIKDIRDKGSRIPVIILTAKTDEDTVVEGLQCGANDYVRKPFGNKELLARIKTVLREPQRREHQARYSDLLVLIDKRRIMYGEDELELDPREFDILNYFIQHAESVITREALIAAINRDGEIFDRTIDSHVSHVRRRLRESGVKTVQISSVYGVGYRMEKKC